MALNKKTRRIMLVAVWMAVCGGVVTLLVAANNRKKDMVCAGVSISIRGTGEDFFIDKNDISGMLRHGHGSSLKGAELQHISLSLLEEELEGNAWIQDAELYFDSRNILQVRITERQPVARIFTTAGSSFYMDSAGVRLPLLPRISARVPVVTGFPPAKRLNAADSAVLLDVKNIVRYITSDVFWNAQIAQVDVQPDRRYELLPVVGSHLIRIGTAEKIEEKLHRLLVLYRQVLSKTGFDKYRVLDVQYEGQVVALKEGGSFVDSAQLQQNIASLVESDQMMAAHKEAAVQEKTAGVQAGRSAPVREERVERNAEDAARQKGVEKRAEKPKVAVAVTAGGKENERVPKAVMPKRN